MAVHRIMGPGRLEAVYQECLEIEFGDIILEIKSEKSLTSLDAAQIINALKTSGFKRGLLINFGDESLRFRRFVN